MFLLPGLKLLSLMVRRRLQKNRKNGMMTFSRFAADAISQKVTLSKAKDCWLQSAAVSCLQCKLSENILHSVVDKDI